MAQDLENQEIQEKKAGPTGIPQALDFTDHFPSFVVAVYVLLLLHKCWSTVATDMVIIPKASHGTAPRTTVNSMKHAQP